MATSSATRRVLPAILLVLFASGWAANHFTAMLPLLADAEHLSQAALTGAFGIYAVGLLPGLLGGGTLSDRIGRRALVLAGAAVAGLGNLALLIWHDEAGIFIGRLVVGAGVGVAVSAGTAWSADVGGGSGSVLAGVALSAGFGIGPLASGLLGQFVGAAITVPFVATIAVSAVAVVVGTVVARTPPRVRSAPATTVRAATAGAGSTSAALALALPMGLWVFACATVAMVTMSERMQYAFTGSWVPGIAAFTTQLTGVGIQMLARRQHWGRLAGAVGAAVAGAGFGVVALAGPRPPLVVFGLVAVLMGIGYGLCLRNGLIDVETLAPPQLRGMLTGVFYVVAYAGFAVPLVLVTITPAVGIVTPMIVLGGLSLATAALRVVQVRRAS